MVKAIICGHNPLSNLLPSVFYFSKIYFIKPCSHWQRKEEPFLPVLELFVVDDFLTKNASIFLSMLSQFSFLFFFFDFMISRHYNFFGKTKFMAKETKKEKM